MPAKSLILSKEVVEKKLQRIALDIAGNLFGEKEPLVIIGITGGGETLAHKLLKLLQPLLTINMSIITCQLNKRKPDIITYSEDVVFDNKNVLLVDDVTNSGLTLLYALKPLLNYHPKRIQTVSLVERMHKNFPVKIDYIGISIATTLHDHIQVEVENNEILGAYIM